MTVATLSATMSERELLDWARYTRARALPTRRLQLQLALIALKQVQVATGDEEVGIEDFLYQPEPEMEKLKAVEGALAIGTIVGGVGVRKLGQGRKKKGAR
jgi:hypothetical protein